ncbi:MAG: Hsp20 family protein [Verrucomicrobiaceae bacterium]|nr:MAG: Hsp20 family protein [Verrucomicrobiaceae bacterium]
MTRTLSADQFMRHFIGFDRFNPTSDAFPPHNIEKLSDNTYGLTLAVAGYAEEDLSLVQKHNLLTVKAERDAPSEREYIHQGIAFRNWERSFTLGDGVEVSKAELKNGLLHIELQRIVPEAEQPRRIAIN